MGSATATQPTPVRHATEAERRRARELRAEGWTHEQIAQELGWSRATVASWVETKRRRVDAVDPAVFLRWLEGYVTTDQELGQRINGRPLTGTQIRALFRIRHEGTAPRYESLDALLVHCGLHIQNDFEQWAAEQEDIETIWACGAPPPGYGDDDWSWWEDLESTDPDWREEGLLEAAARGFELPEGVVLSPRVRRLLTARRQQAQSRRRG